MRCFDDDNVTHVDTTIDSVRDKEIVDTELQLKDLETIENRIQKAEKQVKTGDKQVKKVLDLLNNYKSVLERGKSARTIKLEKENKELLDDLHLLTNKPVLYVCNVDEKSAAEGNVYVDKVKDAIKDENSEIIVIAAAIEADISELDEYDERQMFLEEIGLKESGVTKLIKSAYKLLNLETYFTAGPKEVKAWTYKIGTKAPQAAGIIHSDFEKGFIRAEVIKYKDYIDNKSESACRDAGKIAVEGKGYVVCDGDIMHFRFNV